MQSACWISYANTMTSIMKYAAFANVRARGSAIAWGNDMLDRLKERISSKAVTEAKANPSPCDASCKGM
jgi:hypothetical protein